jgi:hypothetical protein
VSSAVYNAYDIGTMFDAVIFTTEINIAGGEGGTVVHYGGNNTDSYMAGYILYWAGMMYDV